MSDSTPAEKENKPTKKHPKNKNHHSEGNYNNQHAQSSSQQKGKSKQQSHIIDMKKYEKMISDIQYNFSDIKMSNGAKEDCTICCKTCDIFGIGECRHPICIECAIRIRVLNGQTMCPVCRREVEIIHLLFASNGLQSVSLNMERYNHPAEERFGIRFENKDVGIRYEQYLSHVCKICKTAEGDRLEFPTFNSLRQHMANAHEVTYCTICTENLNLFSRERKTYSRLQLQRHIREGDPEDRSQRGHPTCLFCSQRFFDNEGQYRHLRKEHFYCQFCEADGTMTNSFFGKHDDLLKHYKLKHFLCPHEECRIAGIAFATQIEYNVHQTQHSGKGVQLDFHYNDRQFVAPGRTRRVQERLPRQPTERIAIVPREEPPPPPPMPNTEIIVVPSAQSRAPSLRYGTGPLYTLNAEAFPTLSGNASSAPQVVVPQQFPRLNRVNKPGNAPSNEPSKNSSEDFPILGGRALNSEQKSERWGQHTGNFQVIDDDERMTSASRPQLPRSVLQPPTSSKLAPKQKQKGSQPSTSDWATITKSKGAITGVIMPKKTTKKTALPLPGEFPEKSTTTPASNFKVVEEVWEDVPYTRKLTNKEKKELQKIRQQEETLKQENNLKNIEEVMPPPDEDVDLQRILLSDIASSIGVSSNSSSTESSRSSANDTKCNFGKKLTVNVSGTSASNNQLKNNKKKTKQKQTSKDDEKAQDFPSLQSTMKKKPPMPQPPEPEPAAASSGISSWIFSSMSNALSGLSLSNILGDNSQPLSSMQTETADVHKRVAYDAPPTDLSSSIPKLSGNSISLDAPPGFENVIPRNNPPPGLNVPFNR